MHDRPSHDEVRATFSEFVDREVRPRAQEIDEAGVFPRTLFDQVGALGFFGMRYPEPDGLGLDIESYVLAIEELARGSMSLAAACAMQSLMGTWFVQRFATGEVRERLVAPALAGTKIGTICMTEPNAGSDLLSMQTRAQEGDGGWRLFGQKTWITSAPVADFFTVFARTSEKSLSVFLVERDAPGLQIGRNIEKMGVRASLTSEVSFDGARATCMLGDPDRGQDYLRTILAEIRVMTAALAVGIAQAALDEAVAYAGQREQFGRPINRFGAVQAHLANMAVDVEAARCMTHWAARRSDAGLDNIHQASMTKLFASEAALRVCDACARVMASYGYANEYGAQRYLRDVRFTLIGGGTSEILRTNIAKGLTS